MRFVKELKEGWSFCETPLGTEEMPSRMNGNWEKVTVPHDWAIRGEFSPENDPQPLENSVLDYHEGMIQIGRTGGLPFIGCGWYERELDLPEGYAVYEIEFDGIMNHGEVFLNGVKIGERAFGYSSFKVDLPPDLLKDSRNVLVVKVNSMDKTSRWYPGAGIFRPVRLVAKKAAHFAYNGIWCDCSTDPGEGEAQVRVHCEGVFPEETRIRHELYAPDGKLVCELTGAKCEAKLKEPILWGPDHPRLYTLVSRIMMGDEVKDLLTTSVGIRSAVFDADRGFLLNGSPLKLQGVCMHHDNGMLGAAYEESVVRHRLTKLKEMGCNALRTTHNPPCPKTLEICDHLGILVIDEAFDEWTIPKAVNGYANDFPRWAEADLTDMIVRDRNHPCVILYSIGNEVPDQVLKEGRETCRRLTEICHRTDPSRPVTCGFNRPTAAIENGLTEEVDVVGLNYSPQYYEEYHKRFPHWKLVATETMSNVSSRGEYYLPAVEEVPPVKHENLQVNSFDLSSAACTYIPDIEFEAQRKAPYMSGLFVWTGYDYLGEPTPYREEWPSRSSYFGIFDLAGIRKDRYYLYASEWGKTPVLHLLPHWNWAQGQLVDVMAYTNLDLVELYLNGRKVAEGRPVCSRLRFGQIAFEPGTLRAVGYRLEDEKRIRVCEDVVFTASEPVKIRVRPESSTARPGEIYYLEVQVTDRNGNLCPDADHRIEIETEGDGTYLAADNGDSTSLRRFDEKWCRAFHGKLMIAVRAGNSGKIRFRLRDAEGKLEEAGFLAQICS